jgi:hypothetical protein
VTGTGDDYPIPAQRKPTAPPLPKLSVKKRGCAKDIAERYDWEGHGFDQKYARYETAKPQRLKPLRFECSTARLEVVPFPNHELLTQLA